MTIVGCGGVTRVGGGRDPDVCSLPLPMAFAERQSATNGRVGRASCRVRFGPLPVDAALRATPGLVPMLAHER